GFGPGEETAAATAAAGRRRKRVRPGLRQPRDIACVDFHQRRVSRSREVVVVGPPLLRRRRRRSLRVACDGEPEDEDRRCNVRPVHCFNPARIFAYRRSKIASRSGSGASLTSPMIMGLTLASLNAGLSAVASAKAGHGGRPLPFGSPVRAKFTQYD